MMNRDDQVSREKVLDRLTAAWKTVEWHCGNSGSTAVAELRAALTEANCVVSAPRAQAWTRGALIAAFEKAMEDDDSIGVLFPAEGGIDWQFATGKFADIALSRPLDGQAALDEANNEIARLRNELDTAYELVRANQPNLDAYQERNRELQADLAAARAEMIRVALASRPLDGSVIAESPVHARDVADAVAGRRTVVQSAAKRSEGAVMHAAPQGEAPSAEPTPGNPGETPSPDGSGAWRDESELAEAVGTFLDAWDFQPNASADELDAMREALRLYRCAVANTALSKRPPKEVKWPREK